MTDLYTDNVEAIAREAFFSPGAFNEAKFAKDFALIIILRKQMVRYLRAGVMNWDLAFNNLIVTMNSFGHTATVRIISEMYNAPQMAIVNEMFSHLGVPGWTPQTCDATRKAIATVAKRYNLEL